MSKDNQTNLRVAVLWHDTVFAETIVEGKRPVTIGEKPSNTLMVPDVAGVGDSHVLFTPDAGGFSLNLTGGMAGRLNLGGKEQTVEAARAAKGGTLSVAGDDWGIIDLGPLAVFFQMGVAPEKLPARPIWAAMESSMLGSLLTALVVHLAFLIAAFFFWNEDPELTSLDLSDRFMKVIVEEPPPEIEEEEEEESVDEDVGKKAGGEEGKFGEEDKVEKSKVPKRDGEMVDKIKDVGIHKALGSNLLGRGPLKNVFGDKTGFDSKLNAAMAGAGDDLVVGHGAGGMGLRGTGSGGGGEGFGRIHGMGRIDTGGGRGTKANLGGKKKRKAKARVRRGKANLSGFCKEADIQRVVAARQRGIQYCYEKELARNPELQGKVTMSWRIGLDGSVVKAFVENSSLGNKQVEGCMTRQIQRWKFPKPEGGMCQIRYPFVFNAGL
ncbi:MAG: energy transducer TonB [Myxococcales bacterium]|nr:energy transducer TonB [Myxococcales bacterium]MCB9537935.1 energy transducer TonB [Myxococcales bacterium]